MKKILVLVCLFLFVISSSVFSQGLTSTDIFNSFKDHMKSDALTFPDDEIYQLVNIGTELGCVFGLVYSAIDTIVLATNTEEYGLKSLAYWVYRIGNLGVGERSWQRIGLDDFGKYQFKEVARPTYWDFGTIAEDVDTQFSAGGDTSYVYVYPKPSSAENGDSISVHYFAWSDSIDANLKTVAHDLVLNLSLMCGYLRAERSDRAVECWNMALGNMEFLMRWMGKVYDIEIVPKNVGGR